jgi:hypothetical protein
MCFIAGSKCYVKNLFNHRSNQIMWPLLLLAFGTFDEALDSTCLIKTDNNYGTGVVYAEDANYFYICSAGHVLRNNGIQDKTAKIGFFCEGRRSQLVDSEVLWTEYKANTSDDLGVIRLKKELVKGLPIKVIPFDSERDPISVDSSITSWGCANGSWVTGWSGRVTSSNNNYIYFNPNPAVGRSGSPIFNKDSSKIVGIIVMQSTSGGIAVPVPKIRNLLEKQAKPASTKK